jgi:hypothetical protein
MRLVTNGFMQRYDIDYVTYLIGMSGITFRYICITLLEEELSWM